MSQLEDQKNPELTAWLKEESVRLGFAKAEPVIEEKKEEPEAKEPAKPKVETDDIATWSDDSLTVLAESQSELAKDAQSILNKRGVDKFQSEESKEIKALRKELSEERSEASKAKASEAVAQDRKALEARVRKGDISAMTQLFGENAPLGGSLYGEIDMNATMASAAKIIEAENKAKQARRGGK